MYTPNQLKRKQEVCLQGIQLVEDNTSDQALVLHVKPRFRKPGDTIQFVGE